jgi:hypothetical protein
MLFGTRVLVQRGSDHHANNLRVVPGKLIGAYKNQCLVKLDYFDGPCDNPDQTSMWFSKSQVTKYTEETDIIYLICLNDHVEYWVTNECLAENIVAKLRKICWDNPNKFGGLNYRVESVRRLPNPSNNIGYLRKIFTNIRF